MSQQYNKGIKRKRRVAYIRRVKGRRSKPAASASAAAPAPAPSAS